MMILNIRRRNQGTFLLLAGTLLIWMVILILFNALGYNNTWQLWNVDPQSLPFMDFRLIPGSAESYARGYEPSVENPYDPNGRIFNYPAFWRLFFYTGISQDDTIWVSVTMIVLFFISVIFFPEKLSTAGALGMIAVLFSPASMLLYERGNVDLIVFVLCVGIVLVSGVSAGTAAGLIFVGGVVKMFPIFGLSVLLREPKKRFLLFSVVSSLALLLYMLLTWDSVKAAWNFTMRGDGASYGTSVFATRYGPAIVRTFSKWFPASQIEFFMQYGFLALAFILFLLVILLAFRNSENPLVLSERNLAAFRMGSSIYVGTFLLGNNWDYRLAFLVLLVPQLVQWINSSTGTLRRAAWLSMGLVLLSCWHFLIVEIPLAGIFDSAADSMKFWIILDEAFNWMLFASLAFLLVASAPGWVKELPSDVLTKSVTRTHTEQRDARVN
ncbi:MAG TPA: hypothetical protein VHO49_14275 [Anaerolineales bacterium]|nr:hypothetical protein [Anaerolineales bacterium]